MKIKFKDLEGKVLKKVYYWFEPCTCKKCALIHFEKMMILGVNCDLFYTPEMSLVLHTMLRKDMNNANYLN